VLHQAVQVRIYPTKKQQTQLAQPFGCARWWWNYAMNKSIEAYQETGKGLGRSALNALLPDLKKAEETAWLADCYSQILQATTLNLTTAYNNFLINVQASLSSTLSMVNSQFSILKTSKL
jgi:putative transposase